MVVNKIVQDCGASNWKLSLDSLVHILQHEQREAVHSQEVDRLTLLPVDRLTLLPVDGLDRPTSGLLLLAKLAEKKRSLTTELKACSLVRGAEICVAQKFYVARVKNGRIPVE